MVCALPKLRFQAAFGGDVRRYQGSLKTFALAVLLRIKIKPFGGSAGLLVFLRRVEVGNFAPLGRQRQGLVRLGFHKILHALVALRHRVFQAACNVRRPMGKQGQHLLAILQRGDALRENGRVLGAHESTYSPA